MWQPSIAHVRGSHNAHGPLRLASARQARRRAARRAFACAVRHPAELHPPALAPAAVYGVPVAPGRCRAIVRQPFRFKNKLVPLLFKLSPAFLGHLGNNSVLDEDNIFLHMQVWAAEGWWAGVVRGSD